MSVAAGEVRYVNVGAEAGVNAGMNAATDKARGVFITFEGGDGVGKSTHIRFLADALRARGVEVLCLREPGGTRIGEMLREVVLDPQNDVLADESELLIYEAARAQITVEVIRPALDRGAVVLCDRFFDSTVAYQVYGRGLDRVFVDAANAFATQGLRPHRTLLLVLGDAGAGLGRAAHRSQADRLELAGASFHERVAEGFRAVAAEEPARVRVIDSSGERSITSALIFQELSDLFPWMADARICDQDFFDVLDDPFGPYGAVGSRRVQDSGVGAQENPSAGLDVRLGESGEVAHG